MESKRKREMKSKQNNSQYIMCFTFKVKNSKFKHTEKLLRQLNFVLKRLISTHRIEDKKCELRVGTIGDDIINDKSTIAIYFK